VRPFTFAESSANNSSIRVLNAMRRRPNQE
jgi:hypothetical protein